jgi:hypothetical protein
MPSSNLGKGVGSMTVELNMRLLVPKADLDSKRLSVLERKEAAVLAEAAKFEPPLDVRRFEARLRITVNPDKMSVVRTMAIPDLEHALVECFGADSRGLHAGYLPRDDKNRPILNGHHSCVFWFMDKSSQEAPTDSCVRFSTRLTQNTALLSQDMFTEVQLKGKANITLVRPAAEHGEEPTQPIGKGRIKQRLEAHLWNVGGAYLPASTTNGDKVVWPGQKGQKVTELHEFGPPGQP